MSFALGEMGLRDRDFWELTPYELHRRIIGWNRTQEGEQRRTLAGAWYTAAFQRTKRMPNLMRLLKPKKTRKLAGEELEMRKQAFEERVKRAGVAIYQGGKDVV